MRFCYNCGKQVEDNVLICPDCGALVKRYTEDMDQNEIPLTPEQQTEQANFKGRIYIDETGKTRIRGLLKAWLIITAVICGLFSLLMLFDFIMFPYLETLPAQLAELPKEVFARFGGYDSFLNYFENLVQYFKEAYIYFIILAVLCFLKTSSDIWLLISKRKIAFIFRQGLILLLSAICLLMQDPITAILFATDGFVTSLLLGQDKLLLK